MKGKVFVGVLLGLILLGVINMAFGEEQPKPQARERFVLKELRPAISELDFHTRVLVSPKGLLEPGNAYRLSDVYIPVGEYQGPKEIEPVWSGAFTEALIEEVPSYPLWGFPTAIIKESVFILKTTLTLHTATRLEVVGPEGYLVGTHWECNGSTHLYEGKSTPWKAYTFDGDAKYPLTFKKVHDVGYVYLCGRGTVTTPDSKTHRLGYDDTVDIRLPCLKSEDMLDREGATQALGYLAKTKDEKDKSVPALIEALNDKAMEVRRNAAEALGRLRDERATEVLVLLLKDSEAEWWVADVAAESLCRIGKKLKPETVAQIAASLKSDETMERACAAQALGVGGTEAVEPLISALADKEASVKAAAVQSLIFIGETKGMDEALKAVQEEKVRRSISDWALRLEMNRDNVLKFLNDALQEPDKDVRAWAVQRLGEIGDKSAIEALKEALAKEQDLETKKAMEEAIGKLEKFE